MSIYPVKLAEWYPVGDPQHEYCYFLVKISRCYACYGKVRFSKAIGHHSIPWGHGDIWCSEKCIKSGKIGKPDKRQRRKIKRKEILHEK